jgi:hypothetical protein
MEFACLICPLSTAQQNVCHGRFHKSHKHICTTLKRLSPKLPCRMRCAKCTWWICWHGKILHNFKFQNDFQQSSFSRRNRQNSPSVNSVKLDIWVVGVSGSCRVCCICSRRARKSSTIAPVRKTVGMSQLATSIIMSRCVDQMRVMHGLYKDI